MDRMEVLATHPDTPEFFGTEEIEKLQSAFVTIKSSGFPTSGREYLEGSHELALMRHLLLLNSGHAESLRIVQLRR